MTEPWPVEVVAPPAPTLYAVPSPLGAGVLPEERPFEGEMRCRRVRRVTHDVVEVSLEPVGGGSFAFAPGQYLTLRASIEGEPVERCYTISSPPTRPHLLTITVKRVPDGPMSGWLHDRLAVGDRLWASGPMGGFSVREHPASSYLLLSGGSGITPTLSTLRTLTDLAEPLDVVVVHHTRSPADLIERAELDAIAGSRDGVRVVWVVDEADDSWTGPRGLMSAAQLDDLVPDLHGREVFCCGPAGYMGAARSAFDELGGEQTRWHQESFSIADLPAGEASPTASPAAERAAGAAYRVRLQRSGRDLDCAPGETVLAAAKAAGVRMPSSCTQGLCGTCKSTLVSGEVDMNHAGGIRPREIAAGKFLPCCSTPLGDLVVDI
ncbi:ferredoxin-NADP reductase [Nocardioides albertanoniae]|uniref:Ferredoxin-NADP reductase n=1 Tax=Nocardioides albertanoniae TaxID=1175486 RepID=A0A543AAX6_9ACTN|nr:hybrid-cluster NAD(P)-dependent oxidoreductase [Nocardioides albertanoniae]TQL69762.1 ferredoxin-NADP reductase [Nocardioides albertanoniae]